MDALDKKCKHRNVNYQSLEDFFTVELLNETRRHWKATLGNLVHELPDCNLILDETNLLLEKIFVAENFA